MCELENNGVSYMAETEGIEPSFDWVGFPGCLTIGTERHDLFCVAISKLNTVTPRDSHPIQRMHECIDSLGGATSFQHWMRVAGSSSLDALVLFLGTNSSKQYVGAMTDHHSTIIQEVPTPKIWTAYVTSIFYYHSITSYQIPSFLATNHGT